MTDQICGRGFTTTKPGKEGKLPVYSRANKPYGRILVEGINRKNGEPVRFKSKLAAERHIRNMRLARD